MEIHMCKGSGSDNWGSSVSLDLYRVIATGTGDNNFVLDYVAGGSVANGTAAHIEMRNTASNEWGDNVFDHRLGADGTNSYVIVFNGSHFLYFTTGTVDDWYFDYRYNNGVYSITQTGGGRDSDVLNSSIVWDPRSLTVSNSFGSGNIKLNGVTVASGSSFVVYNNSTHTAERIDRQNSTINNVQYVQVFTYWNSVTSANDPTYSIYMSSNRNVYASFAKEFNITFNLPSGASFYVNSQGYSGTNTIGIKDGSQINVSLSNYVENSFLYSPTGWASGATNYNPNFSDTPADHKTFTLQTGTVIKPVNNYRSLSYGNDVDQPISLSWNEHPNANVSYQIWRRVRHNGVTGNPVQIATVSHGTNSYTDYDYLLTSYYSDDLLWYDVRAYYSVNSSTSDEDFVAIYGKLDPSVDRGNNLSKMNIVPMDYSLSSYPNPFNPTTVIRYSMPEVGQVSLKVYNILSQEVANLVEETKSAGVHTVNFNANNLSTGIYIAGLQAGSKVMSIKLQLIK